MADPRSLETSPAPSADLTAEPTSDAAVSYGREDRTWLDLLEGGLPQASDARAGVAERVAFALMHDALLDARRIRVAAGEGVVTLAGRVGDHSDRALAGLIARRQDGVAYVNNRLQTDDDLPIGLHN